MNHFPNITYIWKTLMVPIIFKNSNFYVMENNISNIFSKDKCFNNNSVVIYLNKFSTDFFKK